MGGRGLTTENWALPSQGHHAGLDISCMHANRIQDVPPLSETSVKDVLQISALRVS